MALNNIAYAVVNQAIDDWRYLCQGGEPAGDCNFRELERFFEREYANYMDDETAARIYKMLKLERGRMVKN